MPLIDMRPRRALANLLVLVLASLTFTGAATIPSRTATADAPSDTRAASAISPCMFRPTKSTTGARGELRSSGRTTVTSGKTIKNVSLQSLVVVGWT